MDTIDPSAKIPSPILEKTRVTQKADEKEPQRERPGYHGKKKAGAPLDPHPEEAETGDKQGIDILV